MYPIKAFLIFFVYRLSQNTIYQLQELEPSAKANSGSTVIIFYMKSCSMDTFTSKQTTLLKNLQKPRFKFLQAGC